MPQFSLYMYIPLSICIFGKGAKASYPHGVIYCAFSLYLATMAARRAAEEAGRDGSKAAQAASFTGISLQEAQQILNIKDIDDIDIIRKVSIIIDHLEHDI